MTDEGLIEIQRLLNTISHGDLELRAKLYNGNIAKIEIPYIKKYKLDYSRAMAYYMEKLRDAQALGKDSVFTITTDVRAGGNIYLMDSGYDSKTFKIEP